MGTGVLIQRHQPTASDSVAKAMSMTSAKKDTDPASTAFGRQASDIVPIDLLKSMVLKTDIPQNAD